MATNPLLPAGLRDVLDEFTASPVGQELHDPRKAEGWCKPAALALLGLLHERGFTEAELQSLARGDDRGGETHFVIKLGSLGIDPSARQFGPGADVPMVDEISVMIDGWTDRAIVRLDDPWDRTVHKVPEHPAPWSAARKGLPTVGSSG